MKLLSRWLQNSGTKDIEWNDDYTETVTTDFLLQILVLLMRTTMKYVEGVKAAYKKVLASQPVRDQYVQ